MGTVVLWTFRVLAFASLIYGLVLLGSDDPAGAKGFGGLGGVALVASFVPRDDEGDDNHLTPRLITGVAGLAVWAWGLAQFIDGDEVWGGAFILLGGFLVIVALRGGWAHWWEGLTNWLYFR